MDIRGRETQDMGTQDWQLPPGWLGTGWVLWSAQGTWRPDRRPPGQRPCQDPWRSRELGQPWRIRGFERPWQVCLWGRGHGPSPRPGLYGWSPTTPPPPKQIPLGEVEAGSVWLSGGAGTLGCSGGAGIWGHSGKTLNICIKQLSLQLKCSVCWLIIRIVPPGTTVPFPQIFFCLTFFNLTNLNVKCKC